VAKEF